MRKLLWLFVPAVLLAQVNVPYERIRDADKEPGNWLTYSRDYSGQRYSPLDQIIRGNVGQLRIAWMRQVDETDTFETSPIVVDGTLFITAPPNVVEALDAATGRVPVELPQGSAERSAVVLRQSESRSRDSGQYALLRQHGRAPDRARRAHGRRALGRNDGRLQDGLLRHGAPLAVKDKIITGMAGGEYGTRGFIDGYDAKTGKRLWRFNTIPDKGEPGNETWAGDSWKTGAATRG